MNDNLLKNLKKRGSMPSRNKFTGLSHVNTYSSKLGMALPACSLETVPNDYFEISASDVTVMLPFLQASFAGLTYKADWFFVPYSYLWSQFPQMIVGRKDLMTDLITNPTAPTMVPSIRLKTLVTILCQDQNLTVADKFGAFRLLDLLGYGNFSFYQEVGDIQTPNAPSIVNLDGRERVNPFRLLAYQKIWHDFYRNPYFDVQQSAEAFNIDSVGAVTPSSDLLDIGDSRICKMCLLRQVPYRKDLYTGVLPSASFGGVSTVNIDFKYSGVDWEDTDNEEHAMGSAYFDDGTLMDSDGTVTPYFRNLNNAFDVLELVRAQAAQEWAYTTLRNGNRLSSAWEGHFGTTPDYGKDHVAEFLGSWQGTVKTDVVVSSSDTQSAALGAKAATGSVSLQGDPIKFQSHDYGVLMCITSVVPDVQYPSTGCDVNNTLIEQFDFYTPEFDNTGFVPLPDLEFINEDNFLNRRNLGFLPMWYGYKIAKSKSHGEFCNLDYYMEGSLSPFVINNSRLYLDPQDPVYEGRGIQNFYVDPHLDEMLFAANGIHQSQDHYWHHIYFDIKALRAMSELGLPNF